jgi:hypothetical protein
MSKTLIPNKSFKFWILLALINLSLSLLITVIILLISSLLLPAPHSLLSSFTLYHHLESPSDHFPVLTVLNILPPSQTPLIQISFIFIDTINISQFLLASFSSLLHSLLYLFLILILLTVITLLLPFSSTNMLLLKPYTLIFF